MRLTNVLYGELAWLCSLFGPARPSLWSGRSVTVRYHPARPTSRQLAAWTDEYTDAMARLNEAYLMLPVLNLAEAAIRSVTTARRDDTAVAIESLQWADAKEAIERADGQRRDLALEVMRFLALLCCEYSQSMRPTNDDLLTRPIEVLYSAVQSYYSAPENRRYPRDHHQLVFEATADVGPRSYIARRRRDKWFCLGDELLFLIVLALFEEREPADRTSGPRELGELLRERVPLASLEERLERDMLVPADTQAYEALKTSLARLGLLDRLSDVGAANFLRHPLGV